MDSSVTVCKLPLYGKNTFVRLKTEWYNDKFNVTIFHVNTVWTSKVTAEDIKMLSHRLSMSINDYICESRFALTTHGGAKEFCYLVEDGRFLWKKFVDNDEDIKIKFGSTVLEEVPCFEMLECMLDTVIDSNIKLMNKIKSLETEKQEAALDKQEIEKKLQKYQREKIEMEETLYSNFLDILNAKKKRIRILEKHIDQFTSGTSKPGKVTLKSIVFDSDSDVGDRKSEDGDSLADTKALRLPMISEKSSRKIINEDSDDDKAPAKVLLRRKVRSKRNSKVKSTSTNTGKRKEKDSDTLPCGFPDLSSHQSSQAGTSGLLAAIKTEEGNHYDSETDVDQCTDDENNSSAAPVKVTKPLEVCMENLFDDIRKPAPTCTLPKRMRRQPVPDPSESTTIPTIQVNTKPSRNLPDKEKRFNTQELLDELIN